MDYSYDRTVEILSRTPEVLRAMLAGVSEEWTHADYGADTFSPRDVVGHLIHGERVDFVVRARIILEHGEARPFEPFDRFAQRQFMRDHTLAELLDQFAELRGDNLRALAAIAITDEQLELCGTHPTLGTVTLRQLLSTWTVHDLNHIAQIAKSMAYQYRDNVGVWRAYLPILPR